MSDETANGSMRPAPVGVAWLRRVNRPVTRASLVGLAIGALLGAWIGYAGSTIPTDTLFPPDFSAKIVSGIAIALMFVVGGVCTIPRDTRSFGRLTLLAACVAILGLPLGSAVGPRYQAPPQLAGHLTVRFTAPVEATLDSSAECTRMFRDTTLASVSAHSMGRVGVDDVGMRVGPAPEGSNGSVEVLVNGLFGYTGTGTVVEGASDAMHGRLAFSLPARGERLGGPGGAATLDGELTWSCVPVAGTGPGPGPAATAAAVVTSPVASPSTYRVMLQGASIDLHGLVDAQELRVTGTCDSALLYRVGSLDTIASWPDGRRARLSLVPGDVATLIVDFGTGKPERVAAPATLTETRQADRPSAGVRLRVLDATFELPDGRLEVHAQWDCGEKVERLAGSG